MEMAVYLRESRRIVARKTWERAPGAGYQWYDLGEVDLRAPDYFITLTRSWCLSMTPPCLPELIGGPCRIKAHVKFGEAGVSVDRGEPRECAGCAPEGP